MIRVARPWLAWLPVAGLLAPLLLLLGLGVWGTAVHAGHMLSYPYPLDYGEGPLMAQVNELLNGRPLPQLYADPAKPPYLVVNYPPASLVLFQAAAAAVDPAGAMQPSLLGGRLVVLAATALSATALVMLAAHSARPHRLRALALVALLLFLALSLVREWAPLMRVDMVALAAALWALALAQRAPQQRWAAIGAGLLCTAALLAKPSFIAAPAAIVLWLLAVAPRRGMLTAAVAAVTGLAAGGALQLLSGGWFLFHVLEANVNPFDTKLARAFWSEHLQLHWPLLLGAILGLGVLVRNDRSDSGSAAQRSGWALPALYAVFATLSALGVGKVGAYSNYFLEMDAALVWASCAGLLAALGRRDRRPALLWWSAPLILLMLLGQAVRYHPLWDQVEPRPASAKPRLPRLIIGRFPIWSDLAHEREVLEGQRRVQQAITREIQAVGEPVMADIPGYVVAAGAQSRLQAFEMRQLFDQGLMSQDALLHELANGRIRLVLLEWLGNWLSPEMVTLIQHRYARAGSLGQMHVYRPVAVGPYTERQATAPDGPQLEGFHLLPPIDGDYRPGEQLATTLRWTRGQLRNTDEWQVRLELRGAGITWPISATGPLLYGILPISSWPESGPLEQVVRLDLPQLAPGSYTLAVSLLHNGAVTLNEPLASVTIGAPLGRSFAEVDRYVPAPFLAEWNRLGGLDFPGYPMTPPIPFEAGWLQCFERVCLQLPAGKQQPTRLPLGEILALELPQVEQPLLVGPFARFWEARQGQELFGPPITGELRNGWPVVQYLRYARLERAPDGTDVGLGRLGAEYMKLNEADRFTLP